MHYVGNCNDNINSTKGFSVCILSVKVQNLMEQQIFFAWVNFQTFALNVENELNGIVAGRTSSWASDEKTKNVDDKKAKTKVINKIFMMILIVYWNKSKYQLLM